MGLLLTKTNTEKTDVKIDPNLMLFSNDSFTEISLDDDDLNIYIYEEVFKDDVLEDVIDNNCYRICSLITKYIPKLITCKEPKME